METESLRAWLRLVHGAGLSRRAVRRLLKAFGEPLQVWAAGTSAWQDHLTARQWARTQLALSDGQALQAERERDFLTWLEGPSSVARRVVTLGDPAYPSTLLNGADPPLLLFAQGQLACLSQPGIAVIGSRQASPQGRQHAHDWSRELGARGWTVVSGLAYGIDAAAHEGALASIPAGTASDHGTTIAVVATGLDQVYPRRHTALAERIQAQGLLLSEYPPGSPPLPERFPERNRIIAGLSQGTLVVEAAMKSGSLITARLALESGREVWAIPGSIHAPQSQGCHALIRQGAALVTSVDELLEDLPVRTPLAGPERQTDSDSDIDDEAIRSNGTARHSSAGDATAGLDATALNLLHTLGTEAMTVDGLSARTGRDGRDLAWNLLELELQGHVRSLPGGLWQRLFRA
jgi:DNA processing protein